MPKPPVSHRRVLVADDSAADLEIVERAFELTSVPVRLESVEDGEKTLARLGLDRSSDEDAPLVARLPDLVLLDLNLPRLSGRDVLEAIRKSDAHRHLPVLIMSGSSNPSDVHWCYAHGCNAYVQKSEFKLFRDDIRRLADFWLNTALLPG